MKQLQSVIVILFIAIFLFGAYFASRYLQRVIRPGESFGRLLIFMLSCLLLVFVLSFLLVFIVTSLFPNELRK